MLRSAVGGVGRQRHLEQWVMPLLQQLLHLQLQRY